MIERVDQGETMIVKKVTKVKPKSNRLAKAKPMYDGIGMKPYKLINEMVDQDKTIYVNLGEQGET